MGPLHHTQKKVSTHSKIRGRIEKNTQKHTHKKNKKEVTAGFAEAAPPTPDVAAKALGGANLLLLRRFFLGCVPRIGGWLVVRNNYKNNNTNREHKGCKSECISDNQSLFHLSLDDDDDQN